MYIKCLYYKMYFGFEIMLHTKKEHITTQNAVGNKHEMLTFDIQ